MKDALESVTVLELSCESLAMQFVDARREVTVDDFVAALKSDLRRAPRIRLRDAFWLEHGELSEVLEPLFADLRSRGGIIEHVEQAWSE